MKIPLSVRLFVGVCLAFGIRLAAEGQSVLTVETEAALPGTAVSLTIELDHESALGDDGDPKDDVGGFSFGIDHDEDVLTLSSIDVLIGGAAGADPDFVLVSVEESFGAVGVILAYESTTFELFGLVEGVYSLAEAAYEVESSAPAGLTTVALDTVGSPPIVVELSTPAGVIEPDTVDGGVFVLAGAIDGVIPSDQLWVPDTGTDSISVVSPASATVATTLSEIEDVLGSLQTDPTAVAFGENGVAWVAFSATDTIVRFATGGTEPKFLDSIAVGDAPAEIGVAPDGSAWVACAGDASLWRLSASGEVLRGVGGILGDAIPVGSGSRGLAIDALGNVWVASSEGQSITKLDSDGEVAVILSELGSDADPLDLAIDSGGFVWSTLQGRDIVQKRAADGSLVREFTTLDTGSAPGPIAIRRFGGSDEAWVAGTGNGTVYRLLADGTVESFTGLVTPSGVAVDANGIVWVADADGDEVVSFDELGERDRVTVGDAPGFLGDPSGYVLALVIASEIDSDGDTFSSAIEIEEGSNPFDAEESPFDVDPEFLPAVEALTCQSAKRDVTIAWAIPLSATYESLEVERTDPEDSVTTFELASATATLFEDENLVLDGIYEYRIVATGSGSLSSSAECIVVVGAGAPIFASTVLGGDDATNLFDVAARPGDDDSLVSYFVTDAANGQIYALDAEFQVVDTIRGPFDDAPTTGIAYYEDGDEGRGSLFVARGVPDEQAVIQQISLTGQPIGDPLALVDESGTPFIGGILGLAAHPHRTDAGTAVLFGDLDTCEIWAMRSDEGGELLPGMGFSHPGVDVTDVEIFGLNGIAIAPYAEVDDQSATIVLVQPAEELGEFELVTYEIEAAAGGAEVTEIGAAVPLAALESESVFGGFDFRDGRLAIAGLTTSRLYELGHLPRFERGDVDGNGGVSGISDALYLLKWAFLSGDDPPCMDAADVDGNNTVAGISDAVYLLAYAFTGGRIPPAPGPDECGIDNDSDALGCLYFFPTPASDPPCD